MLVPKTINQTNDVPFAIYVYHQSENVWLKCYYTVPIICHTVERQHVNGPTVSICFCYWAWLLSCAIFLSHVCLPASLWCGVPPAGTGQGDCYLEQWPSGNYDRNIVVWVWKCSTYVMPSVICIVCDGVDWSVFVSFLAIQNYFHVLFFNFQDRAATISNTKPCQI